MSSTRYIRLKIRKNVIKEFSGICVSCGQRDLFHFHHMKMYYLGGQHTEDNLMILCPNCHKTIHDLNIYPFRIQKIIRDDGVRTINMIDNLDQVIREQGDFSTSFTYYIESGVHDALIRYGWYNLASMYLRKINGMDYKQIDFLKRAKFELHKAELNFWKGNDLILSSKMQLEHIQKYLSDLEDSIKAHFYDINGRVITYLADDMKVSAFMMGLDKYNQDMALESFYKSIESDNNYKDKNRVASSIASSFNSMRNYEEALEVCKDALVIAEQDRDYRGIASLTDRIGSIYIKMSNYDDALKYCKSAFIISSILSYKRLMAYSLRHISMAFLRGENVVNSIVTLNLAYRYGHIFGDPNRVWMFDLETEIIDLVGRDKYKDLLSRVLLSRTRYLQDCDLNDTSYGTSLELIDKIKFSDYLA